MSTEEQTWKPWHRQFWMARASKHVERHGCVASGSNWHMKQCRSRFKAANAGSFLLRIENLVLHARGIESLACLKDSPVQTIGLRQSTLRELPLLKDQAAMQNALQELVLAHNFLTQLPLAVFSHCSQLRLLDLANNSLRVLPAEIAHLQRLEVLRLSTNALQVLPQEVAQLAHLKDLLCDHNQLERLPQRIGNLTQLTKLNISFNRLCALPTSLIELTQLQALHASDNFLRARPPAVSHLKCFVDFSNNPFTAHHHEHHHERRNRLGLALRLADAGEFRTAEKLLCQLIAEVKSLPYTEQKLESSQLHYKRGLCRFMLLKRSRQDIEEASAFIRICEKKRHEVELLHAHKLRLEARQNTRHEERPGPPKRQASVNNDTKLDDSVMEGFVQAVSRRLIARQKYRTFANGTLKDLDTSIELQCSELTTAYYLKGLTHMAMHQYHDASDSLTKALRAIHAPLPDHESMKDQQGNARKGSNPTLTIPETCIQLFLCRAETYRGLGQLPSAIADLRHIVSRCPTQHNIASVVAVKNAYIQAWEAEQAGCLVDNATMLRAFDIDMGSGLARRPQVFDIHAEALAAATAKNMSTSQKSVVSTRSLPPAERFRLQCKAHTEALKAEQKNARDPFEKILNQSHTFLTHARDFKREVRANLQMEIEETRQLQTERQIAQKAEWEALEQQKEISERTIMTHEDERMHQFVNEELRLEKERRRRVDEVQRRADAKATYAARLSKRGDKRHASLSQRNKHK